MKTEHLGFLDFALPYLSDRYNQGDDFESIMHLYMRQNNLEDEPFEHDELKYVEELSKREGYVEQWFNTNSVIITTEYKGIIDEYGTLSAYNNEQNEISEGIFSQKLEKEKLEIENLKADLEIAKNTLKEYPRTKWFAIISFIIAVSLAALELIKLLIQQGWICL